jgi:hypothetical protein
MPGKQRSIATAKDMAAQSGTSKVTIDTSPSSAP